MKQTEIPYKIYLSENEIPKYWYNVRADMKNKPAPLLNPATHKPMTAEELEAVFCRDLVDQELNDTDQLIEIPGEIRDFYKMYLCWYARTVWRKNWARLQRSTTNLREITPAAATS